MKKVLSQQMAHDFCYEAENLKSLVYVENIRAFAYYKKNLGYYKLHNPEEFRRVIYRYLVHNFNQQITASIVKDIIEQVKWMVENRIDDLVDSKFIALNDKLLNLDTLEYEDYDQSRVTFYNINVKSEDIALNKLDRFKTFLNEVLVKKGTLQPDLELIQIMQEMFGYCLLNTLEGHATFFLVGSGGNGKSVILNLLREMVGNDFTTSMTIENITTNRFAPVGLIGKKINICLEEESKYVRPDKFKALVAGDPINIEYKYGDHFEWQPTLKYIFSANKLPTFENFDRALMRRLKIIPFNNDIDVKKQDTQLIGKLRLEMGGIVAWAIEGIKRIRANGFKFTIGSEMEAQMKMFSGNLSSAILFFSEGYEENESGMIFNEQLYEDYKAWAEKRGKKQQSYYSFFGDLDKVLKIPGGSRADNEGIVKEYKKISIKKSGSNMEIEF